MKKLISLIIVAGIYLLLAGNSLADVSCQPIYGGGQTCIQTGQILINKTVQNPQTGAFVDNLGVNDPKFSPSQTVTFHITITNTGSATINNTTVSDTFPQFVDFVSGPGNFDSNTKTLTFQVASLGAGQPQTFTVVGETESSSQLPSSQGITCVVNQAVATADNGGTSSDNAQFCIQQPILAATTKGGLPVLSAPQMTTTPPTGPEALPLMLLFPGGLAGIFFRNKSKKFKGGEK